MTDHHAENAALRDAALDYAARGFHVFPVHTVEPETDSCSCGKVICRCIGRCTDSAHHCANPGKHPLSDAAPKGLHDATTDRITIQQWWALYPDANIGIRTGATSGIVVLDADLSSGGDQTAAQLEAQHGSWPETPTVITGRDGAHLYFQHPGKTIPNSAGRLGTGIDIRGDGGYVLAPPSLHATGRRYEWAAGYHLHDMDCAPFPGWIIAALEQSTHTGFARLEPDEIIAEGGRNDRLTRLAGLLRRDGLTGSEIRAALMAVNATRCRPPLPADEIDTIATSVTRYPPATRPATIRVAGMEMTMRRRERR